MEPSDQRVKGVRRYDSAGRSAQAERARSVVLDSAQRLFLAHGYAATTIAAIATDAGVSVETIYKTFNAKPGLVRAIRDRALTGDEPLSTEERSDRMRANEPDPRRIIENWGRLTTEVLPRVAPILLVVRSAAEADPELARLRDQLDADRLARMTDNARHLLEGGHLRPDITLDQARDVMFTYSSPELYELLVLRRGWPVERYGRFASEAMIAALLPPPQAP